MKVIPLVTALALSLAASMSLAQDANTADMMSGMTMIQTNTEMAFNKYGIKADVNTLTLGQLAAIAGVLTDPQKDSGGKSAKMSIEAILANN